MGASKRAVLGQSRSRPSGRRGCPPVRSGRDRYGRRPRPRPGCPKTRTLTSTSAAVACAKLAHAKRQWGLMSSVRYVWKTAKGRNGCYYCWQPADVRADGVLPSCPPKVRCPSSASASRPKVWKHATPSTVSTTAILTPFPTLRELALQHVAQLGTGQPTSARILGALDSSSESSVLAPRKSWQNLILR